MPDFWQAEQGPRVWQQCWESQSWCQVAGDEGMVPDTIGVGPGVSQSFCWPAGGQKQDSDGPRVHGLQWAVGICRPVVSQRLLSAPWYVELRLRPLADRAVSSGMSRGGCGRRKSLGSLSADGWGCVCPVSHLA